MNLPIVDLAVNIYDENRLRWISWDRCISKEQELDGDKKEQAFMVSGNTLKLESRSSGAVADTSWESLHNDAFTRRSLAMDQANLVDFTVMQSWTEKIMKTRVDVPPAGFQKPSMQQLMAADVKCFEELSDKANAKGRPLDAAIPHVIHMPGVTSLMQPMPQMGPSDLDYGKVKESPVSIPVKGPYLKGKGGGKGKKGKSFARMPAQLLGCNSHTARSDPICYSFNLECCTGKVDRGCPNIFHVCCAPKCGGHRPAVKCASMNSPKPTCSDWCIVDS